MAQRDQLPLVLVAMVIVSVVITPILVSRVATRQKVADSTRVRYLQQRSAALARAEDDQFLKANYARFTAYAERLTPGAKRRLDWIALIEKVKTDLDLIALSFEISPYRYPDKDTGLTVGIGQEIIDISMRLRHDQELIEFFDHLKSGAQSPYEIFSLQITRKGRLDDGLTTPCLLYTSPSPRDATLSRMPSSA